MSNANASKPNRFTHNVVLQDGFKVPCNGLDDAKSTKDRFAARGISGRIELVQG